jgi:hypothetical protein
VLSAFIAIGRLAGALWGILSSGSRARLSIVLAIVECPLWRSEEEPPEEASLDGIEPPGAPPSSAASPQDDANDGDDGDGATHHGPLLPSGGISMHPVERIILVVFIFLALCAAAGLLMFLLNPPG